jgi:hypothetical protein
MAGLAIGRAIGVDFLVVIHALVAKWYVRPRCAVLPFHDALIPLFLLQVFRHAVP